MARERVNLGTAGVHTKSSYFKGIPVRFLIKIPLDYNIQQRGETSLINNQFSPVMRSTKIFLYILMYIASYNTNSNETIMIYLWDTRIRMLSIEHIYKHFRLLMLTKISISLFWLR